MLNRVGIPVCSLALLALTMAAGEGYLPAGRMAVALPAIAFAPRHYICQRRLGALRIDGRLDEAAWARAPWSEEFGDIVGPGKPAPRLRTRVKLLWDDRCLYIGAELDEPDVWATLRTRDAVIYQDNDFEVFIDPDGDSQLYYELEINALNTVWDLLLAKPYRDGGPAINGWDLQGLQSAVHVDGTLNRPGDRDRGWQVELALPWESLKECAPQGRTPLAGEYWRLNFSRVEWPSEPHAGGYRKLVDGRSGLTLPEDNWTWSPQGMIAMHAPEMWGYLHFSMATSLEQAEKPVLAADERIKWRLREIYYRQWLYYQQTGRFSPTLAGWTFSSLDLPGYAGQAELHVWPVGFHASLPVSDGSGAWHIRADGLVWRE
jgi:hypothetical protein